MVLAKRSADPDSAFLTHCASDILLQSIHNDLRQFRALWMDFQETVGIPHESTCNANLLARGHWKWCTGPSDKHALIDLAEQFFNDAAASIGLEQ